MRVSQRLRAPSTLRRAATGVLSLLLLTAGAVAVPATRHGLRDALAATTSSPTPVDSRPGPRRALQPVIALPTRPSKVLLIIDENKTAAKASASMPYLASLGRTYGSSTAYSAVTHPSLPNYLALVGGSTFGVRDDASPSSHPLPGASVFDRVLAAGGTAKTYAEAMPAPCSLVPSGRYAVKHNPWAYFADATSRANCKRFDVPSGTTSAGALLDDVRAGALPDVGLVVPDLCNDAHDCSMATADDWLRRWVPVLQAGADYRAGRLAIVLTFDEDDGSAGNQVLTTVVAPRMRRGAVDTPLTHWSWLRYAAERRGVAPFGEAVGATSLGAPFGI